MTKNKLKPIALLVANLLLGTLSFAQGIHFNYTNGTNATYNLEDVRKITFDADVMNLHLWDGSVYSWNVSTTGYFEYDEASLNVQELLYNANVWEVTIFPNPTSSKVTIGFNLPQTDDVSIELYNTQGKLILTKNLGKKETCVHQEVLDLSNVPQGTYVCCLSGQKNTITKQLIIH